MKLSALLLAGITLMQVSSLIQAQPVVSLGQDIAPASAYAPEPSNTRLYIYNDGVYVKVADAQGIKTLTVEIKFQNYIEATDVTTTFGNFPLGTFKNATLNNRKLTLSLDNSKIISGDYELNVAFIEYPTNNPIQYINVQAIYHDNTEKNYTTYLPINMGTDYLQPNIPELPMPEVRPELPPTPGFYWPPVAEPDPFPTPEVYWPPVAEPEPLPTPGIYWPPVAEPEPLPMPGIYPDLGIVFPELNFPTPEIYYKSEIEQFEVEQPTTNGRITTVSMEIQNENIFDDNAITHIPDKILEEAIEDVLDESDDRDTNPRLSIDINSPYSANRISIKLDSDSLTDLLFNINSILEMDTDLGEFMLDFDAVDGLLDDADNDDIIFSIANDNALTITDAQQNAVRGEVAYEIEVVADDEHITDFDSDVEVTVQYTLPYKHDEDTVTVFNVDENGKLTEVDSKYYPTSKKVVFKTDYLSLFMIDSTR